ncbi:dnaJ homolog subfamily C member 11-like [Anneissia japonica]|uniref:dnaJ homolog subfamily C member 11-like n=1 Tax=Anneissia japonica TaxID=1529436 RepID=UPI001425A745|nr:dnaJ homolog subfamily C member 11-like [Anneissia japonica]
MAAPMEGIDVEKSDDLYAILNARKDASEDELKSSYRRLCMLYHPDKHVETADKEAAEMVFNKVQRAYAILHDPQKRAIYDIYGEKGLEAEWDVVPRTRTPQEIMEEFERLQRQREERRLQQSTNPRGIISVGVDATDVFDYYQDPTEEVRSFPNIEINSMAINQSIDCPLTTSDTVTLTGSLSTRNGNGSGEISTSFRRLTSYQSWGEIQITGGNGPQIGLKGFRNFSRRSFGTMSGICQLTPHGFLAPALITVVARQLDKHTIGYLTWKWGMQSAMTSMLIRDTTNTRLVCQLQLGIPNSFASVNMVKKFEHNDAKLNVAVKAGSFGAMLEYGVEKKISQHSRLGAKVTIGVPVGVTLKIRLSRANQTFVFPIHLSQEMAPNAIFYGTVVPIAVYWLVKVIIVNPFMIKMKEENIQKKREANASSFEQKKQEAETEVRLMTEIVKRIIETEQTVGGLIIIQAWYGKLVDNSMTAGGERNGVGGNVIDVTIPLQSQVKDSRLLLTDASKANLPGFYDPCVGEESCLRVLYRFHNTLHECTVADNESLRIPKQSHRLDPS